jgi:hypothetical protein
MGKGHCRYGHLYIPEGILSAQAPFVPTEVLNPAKRAAEVMGASAWLRKLTVKLFRPHVYFFYDLSNGGGQLRSVMRATARVLPILGGKDASQRAEFLTHLARTSWII